MSDPARKLYSTQVRVSENICKKKEKLVQDILDRYWRIDNGLPLEAPAPEPVKAAPPVEAISQLSLLKLSDFRPVNGRWYRKKRS